MSKGEPLPFEYNCPICKDAGFVYPVIDGKVDASRVVPCDCQKDTLREKRQVFIMKFAQLPANSGHMTMRNFQLKNNETLREARDASALLSVGDESIKFLTLLSVTGLGKTHLAVAICRQWLLRGKMVRYVYVPRLLDEIRDSYKTDAVTGQSYSRLMETFYTVPLLALDDLGTEKKSDWAQEKLQDIVDRRSGDALPLVVTTNKPLDGLPNDEEGRIASRLKREPWCKVVVMEPVQNKKGAQK